MEKFGNERRADCKEEKKRRRQILSGENIQHVKKFEKNVKKKTKYPNFLLILRNIRRMICCVRYIFILVIDFRCVQKIKLCLLEYLVLSMDV